MSKKITVAELHKHLGKLLEKHGDLPVGVVNLVDGVDYSDEGDLITELPSIDLVNYYDYELQDWRRGQVLLIE